MTRCVWVDAGNDDNPTELVALDAYPAFDIREPRLTPAYLEARRKTYGAVCVYAAWNWTTWGIPPPFEGAAKGAHLADLVSGALARVDGNTPDFPSVCVDIETHDVEYIRAFFRRWREHRPRRVTDWTLEGFQGGLFSPADVTIIAGSLVRFAPAYYTGSMAPLAADQVVLDLVAHGFPPRRIVGMYDAAHLPERWNGYAFTQGRLA